MTPFGKLLRQERKERAMLLGDLAEKLGISTPYLSQLETGQKPLKEAFVEKVIRVLEFGSAQANEVRRAAAQTTAQKFNTYSIEIRDDAQMEDRELASHLALAFNRLSPAAKKRMSELLKDETHG